LPRVEQTPLALEEGVDEGVALLRDGGVLLLQTLLRRDPLQPAAVSLQKAVPEVCPHPSAGPHVGAVLHGRVLRVRHHGGGWVCGEGWVCVVEVEVCGAVRWCGVVGKPRQKCYPKKSFRIH